MIPFDFQLPTRIVYGPGRLLEIGTLARELGATRGLVISDPGIVATGTPGRAIESLNAAGIECELFAAIEQNPTTEHVAAGTEIARRFRPDLLVGIGGGSSMDTAKGINFIYSCGGQMRDYWGVGKATGPLLPMIAVPTTAGTGSETQSFALISDAVTHAKMACGDKRAACRVALLDPEVTITQPRRITALTGIDAVAHAVESYVTTRRTPASMQFSREAWRLLYPNFARVLAEPRNLEARGGMQWGAALAGIAIENSMLGAAHSLANPLTAHFGIVHGLAVAIMLPHVVRFNAEVVAADYAELLAMIEAEPVPAEPLVAAERLAQRLTSLAALSGLATHLSDCGVTEESLPRLASEAAEQWTASFNPRRVGESEMLELYRAAF